MIKDLLSLVDSDSDADAASACAISLAKAFGCHATGAVLLVDVIPPTYRTQLPAAVLATAGAAEQERAAAAAERFRREAEAAGVPAETVLLQGTLTAVDNRFARLARHFDLSVVPQATPDPRGQREMLIESALFQSGRPVLVVPSTHPGPMGLGRALVAWDAGRAAARAVADALPLLRRAARVEVVTIGEPRGDGDDAPAFDIGRHLVRQGVPVEVKRLPAGGDVVGALLAHAAEMGANYLVMGGYGHSRLRELILGGATRGILKAMTLPVFMAH